MNYVTWKLHIDHICSKASKGIGILHRARQVLYGQSLLTLYHALLKPHFTYCVTVWGNTYKTHLQKLNVIQKKLVRIITCSEFYAHTAPLLQKLKILNINQLHKYFVCLFVYNSLHLNLSKALCNMFVRNINARKSFDLRPIYRKKKNVHLSIKLLVAEFGIISQSKCKTAI